MGKRETILKRWEGYSEVERAAKIAALRKGYRSKKTQSKLKQLAAERGKPIICLETGTIYESVSAAADSLKIPQPNISSVCNGRRQSCGGFHFRFVEE